MARNKMSLKARAARYVIFHSAFLPKGIGVPLRRTLRAKFMARKKTARQTAESETAERYTIPMAEF